MISPNLTLLITAVKKSANNVIRDFNEIESLLNNSSIAMDYANKTQERLLTFLYNDLAKFKPTYSFILMPKNIINNKDESNTFIINGIVGLKNFAQGLSTFGIEVSLKRDKEIISSVIYNPITNELYCAQKGEGAFFNQKKLRLASFNNTGNISTIATDNYFIKKDSNILNHNISLSNCAQLDICHISSNKINQVCLAKPYNINTIGGSLLIASEACINMDIKMQKIELETIVNQIVLTQNVKA